MSSEIPVFTTEMDFLSLPCDRYTNFVSGILKISTLQIRKGETEDYPNYRALYERVSNGVEEINNNKYSVRRFDTIWTQNILVFDSSEPSLLYPAIGVFILGSYSFGMVRLNNGAPDKKEFNLVQLPVTNEEHLYPTCEIVRPLFYYYKGFKEQDTREGILLRVFDLLQEGIDAEDYILYQSSK